jgi:hypothetical protein
VSRLRRHYKPRSGQRESGKWSGCLRSGSRLQRGYPAPVPRVSGVYGMPCGWTAMLGAGRSVGGFAEKCPAPSSGRPGVEGAGRTPDEVNHGPRDFDRRGFALSGACSSGAGDVGSPRGRPAGLVDPSRHVHNLTCGPIESSPSGGPGEPRPCAEESAEAERRPA